MAEELSVLDGMEVFDPKDENPNRVRVSSWFYWAETERAEDKMSTVRVVFDPGHILVNIDNSENSLFNCADDAEKARTINEAGELAARLLNIEQLLQRGKDLLALTTKFNDELRGTAGLPAKPVEGADIRGSFSYIGGMMAVLDGKQQDNPMEKLERDHLMTISGLKELGVKMVYSQGIEKMRFYKNPVFHQIGA
jgi:hypothetical protein